MATGKNGGHVQLPSRTGRKQPNALLTFSGEQDAEFLIAALKGACDLGEDDSGGSRVLSVRGEGGNIVIGYKSELDV